TQTYTLSLHDALPISRARLLGGELRLHLDGNPSRLVQLSLLEQRLHELAEDPRHEGPVLQRPEDGERGAEIALRLVEMAQQTPRSEEHTSELQSPYDL